jgi:hypothetical protein
MRHLNHSAQQHSSRTAEQQSRQQSNQSSNRTAEQPGGTAEQPEQGSDNTTAAKNESNYSSAGIQA